MVYVSERVLIAAKSLLCACVDALRKSARRPGLSVGGESVAAVQKFFGLWRLGGIRAVLWAWDVLFRHVLARSCRGRIWFCFWNVMALSFKEPEFGLNQMDSGLFGKDIAKHIAIDVVERFVLPDRFR